MNIEQPKILVAIRKRPLSKKETNRGEADIISVKNEDTVIVSEYKQKVDLTKYLEETIFNFDFAFHEETCNEEIYQLAVRPLVDSAFQGAKVTCFAYGQTGSGKTHTMNGNMGQGIPGLYTLGANDIFEYLASPQFRHLRARLSFYQIYCGKLYDLLNKRAELKLREDNKNNINIIGLEEASVSTSEEFIEYLAQGSKERVTSQNSANADSSRSHAILQISLKEGKKLFGKISFIDLAGNQRGADHMDMDKQTRIDGAEINKSLLSLKQCIRALDQGKGHTPFRGSKLTMVLKDSFVGFCRTLMIGNVSPSSASSQNTLNTLRYADRVKQLRKPQQGVTREQQKAKEMMLPRQNKNAIRIMINNDDDAEDIARKRDQAQKQYGIVEELPPKKKEELSARNNSFNGGKLQPSKQETKSSSVAKNHLANSLGNKTPLTNNLMGPPPPLNNKPQNMIGGNTANKRVQESPFEGNRYGQGLSLNRYNSSQYGVLGKKDEPMQIESSSSPYYLPNKNVPNNGGLFSGSNNQNRPFNASSNFSMMNQSQNTPGTNYNSMNNGMNNNSMNNISLGPNQYGQPNRGNPNHESNSFYNNYNQSNATNTFKKGNFPKNSFQNQPNNNLFQNRQQQQYLLPQNWQDMVATVSNSDDPNFTQQVVAQMNERLFIEQSQLIRCHSDSLRTQIDIIKSEMSELNQMEIDKSKITSRGYVQFMQESIEEKVSLLEELREKLISFTYKLDAIEEIERQRRQGHIDDEQLLDDIN